MFSIRKQPAQVGSIKPITTARVVEKITRLQILSANDPELKTLLEELKPYIANSEPRLVELIA